MAPISDRDPASSGGPARASGRVRQLVFVTLTAALLCIAGPASVPLGPVPLSAATLAVMLAGTLLGTAGGLGAVSVYLLVGACGLPVFSGFRGGIGVFLGPTGGYLAGYLCLTAVCGLYRPLVRKLRQQRRESVDPAGAARPGRARRGARLKEAALLTALCLAGNAILYALGTLWYCAVTQTTVGPALAVCVLPFLPGDALKVAVCATLTPALTDRLGVPLTPTLTHSSQPHCS